MEVGFSNSLGILGGLAILWAGEFFHKIGRGACVCWHPESLVDVGKDLVCLRILLVIEKFSGPDESSRLGVKALQRPDISVVSSVVLWPCLVPIVGAQHVL